MKILFLTSGSRIPSTRFRVLAYLPYLRRAGHRCTAVSGFPHKYDYIPWLGFRPSQRLKRIVRLCQWLIACVARFDVVFIEREIFNDDTVTMERRFRRVARRLVLDVDDAIFLNTPEKIAELARMSDLVITGNPQIDEHLRQWNPHTVIIPTSVELRRFPQKFPEPPGEARQSPGSPERQRSIPVIGWIGTSGNLAYLEVVAPALRELAATHEFELRLIVPELDPLQKIDLAGVSVRHVTWNGETEIEELAKIDVGLMPLFPDREWDKYKCPTKLIQYMALGLPAVASPVGFTAEVVTDGEDGFHASSTAEWVVRLGELIKDASLRRRIGQAARATVAKRYSVEANWPILMKALTGTDDRA